MSSLLETYSRTNGAVFMRELVSTRGAHGEPDRAQIRRTCQTVLQSLGQQITTATTRASSLATGTLECKRDAKQAVNTTSRYWTDGKTTSCTEQDKQKSMTRLMSGSNTSIVLPQRYFVYGAQLSTTSLRYFGALEVH